MNTQNLALALLVFAAPITHEDRPIFEGVPATCIPFVSTDGAFITEGRALEYVIRGGVASHVVITPCVMFANGFEG